MGQRHQRYNILPSFSFQLTLFNVKPHITVIIMQNKDVKMLFMSTAKLCVKEATNNFVFNCSLAHTTILSLEPFLSDKKKY